MTTVSSTRVPSAAPASASSEAVPSASRSAQRVESPSGEDLLRGLWRDNPVFVSALGMCPVLAVSNTAVNALTMGLPLLLCPEQWQRRKAELVAGKRWVELLY